MNRLQYEKSPYLLQHKDNPVDWWPWGPEALAEAKRLNRPIFLSIGYATCHWCHVMAHESFESEEVAEQLNAQFIAIKLDREERPDIDDIYMSAVQAMIGQGGWPLSVWLTPEGKPFYGGTYFRTPHFMAVLKKIGEVWDENPGELARDAAALTEHLEKLARTERAPVAKDQQQAVLRQFCEAHLQSFDSAFGGFGSAPKFPQTMNLMVLLRQGERAMVKATLDAMARGGMYDHLMGGFHRYATDRQWTVPHFEKMLYDQAWLTMTYLEGFQVFAKSEYAHVVRETLEYVLREMTAADGGFFSAQDADSLDPETDHGEEGFFAVFSWDELVGALNREQMDALVKAYGISRIGNFEGRNILELQSGFDRSVQTDPVVHSAFEVLRELRRSKPAPLTDDKVLAAWNGWMISAMARASSVLREPKFLAAATAAAEFVLRELFVEERLYRRFRDGERRGFALSDDYAAMIAAFLDLYEATGEGLWQDRAMQFQKLQDQLFWDADAGGYFRDDGEDATLILRVKEDHDGVRPCSNSLSLMNLQRLYHLSYEARYMELAQQLMSVFTSKLERYPQSLPYMLVGVDFSLHSIRQVSLRGVLLQQQLAQRFFPYHVVRPSEVETVQVCEAGVCRIISSLDELTS